MHRVELVRGEDQVQQPCRGASQAIEEVLGAALHMKFLALLCPETVSAPKSLIKTSLFIPPFGGTQKRAVFSFFFFFFFFFRSVFLYCLCHRHLYLQKSPSGVISDPWVLQNL